MLRARSAAASSANDFAKLIGSRLTVLYKIKGDPAHPFTEAVGVLQKVDETPSGVFLEIVKKGGETRSVPVQDIVTFKMIPTRTM